MFSKAILLIILFFKKMILWIKFYFGKVKYTTVQQKFKDFQHYNKKQIISQVVSTAQKLGEQAVIPKMYYEYLRTQPKRKLIRTYLILQRAVTLQMGGK